MGPSALSVVLWAVALVATVWVLLPSIAFALGIGGVRTEVLHDIREPAISGDQAVFDERLGQLEALGFCDAGRTRETGLFMMPGHWRWQQFETTRWFVSPDGRAHATLYRQIRDEPARMSFITMFDDGGFETTLSPGTGDTPSLRGADASQLLAVHEHNVAAHVRDRGSIARVTVAQLAVASDAAERPFQRQIGRGMHSVVLPFAPAALFVVGGYIMGLLWSPLVPLGICVAATAYAFKRWTLLGPIRYAVTRRTHVGDPSRELSPGGPPPAGPSPAGPAEVAPDGTTAATRKAERTLRAAAGLSAGLAPWPIVALFHAPMAVVAGAAVITLQLLFICVTAIATLGVLRTFQ